MLSDPGVSDKSHIRFSGRPVVVLPQPKAQSTTGKRLDATCPVPRQPRPTGTEANQFVRWVLGRAGLDVACYRTEPLDRRLPACLRSLRAASVEQARERIETAPQLLEVALNALLLGVTEFFRDPAVFAAVADQFELLRSSRRGLRIWSAGCSDGAELYSMAMLLAEQGLLENSQLLGTDCRSDAIVQARSGIYHIAHVKNCTAARRDRYFKRDSERFIVTDALRASTQWKMGDVLKEAESGPWNIILWRNSAIYLQPECAAEVWQRLADRLMPGGLLITGRAERPDCGRRLSRLSSCVYCSLEGKNHVG